MLKATSNVTAKFSPLYNNKPSWHDHMFQPIQLIRRTYSSSSSSASTPRENGSTAFHQKDKEPSYACFMGWNWSPVCMSKNTGLLCNKKKETFSLNGMV